MLYKQARSCACSAVTEHHCSGILDAFSAYCLQDPAGLEIDERKQRAGVESIIDGFDSAGWEEIAKIGPAGRSAEECWKQWTHQLRPSLNKADWTAGEDASLLEHVNRLGTHSVGALLDLCTFRTVQYQA